MTALDDAIHARLVGDMTLISLLATYRTKPAVFMVTELPPGVTPPYIAVPPAASTIVVSAKREAGRRFLRDVGCYARAGGDPVVVDAIAERVWELFHKHPLTVVGWGNSVLDVSGPILAPTDHTMYGRIVTLAVNLWKTT